MAVLALLVCVGVWAYEEHPKEFQQFIDNITGDNDAQTEDVPATTNAPPPPPPPPPMNVITPDSQIPLNPDHVRPVEQPSQPGQPVEPDEPGLPASSPLPATNAAPAQAATNAAPVPVATNATIPAPPAP